MTTCEEIMNLFSIGGGSGISTYPRNQFQNLSGCACGAKRDSSGRGMFHPMQCLQCRFLNGIAGCATASFSALVGLGLVTLKLCSGRSMPGLTNLEALRQRLMPAHSFKVKRCSGPLFRSDLQSIWIHAADLSSVPAD